MKRLLLYGLVILGPLWSSCQNSGSGSAVIEPEADPLRVNISLDGITAESAANGFVTRAVIAPVEGEETINDLRLLFFHHSATGDGVFVQDYRIPSSILEISGMSFELLIGRGQGEKLKHSESYSILALANLDGYQTTLPESLENKTESEVKTMLLSLPDRIETSALPMTGTAVKMKDQQIVTISLTRAVVRFDVQNAIRDYFDLVSVSIYGAAGKTPLWGNAAVAGQTHTERFYGITLPSESTENQTGGLYAFENFEGNPTLNRTQTTALVVGLKAKSVDGKTAPGVDEGKTYYYRIDIYPQDEAQNLKRNHVYKVTLRGVSGAGEDTETQAAADTKNPLLYTINNWNLDDEGLIVTNGVNMMAIPSKYLRLGSGSESREYVVYTLGQGTLKITTKNLPAGLRAEVYGNRLIVEADALTGGNPRSGSFTLGFGGLYGSVEVVQSPHADKWFLKLNRKELPPFGGGSTSGISDDEKIAVTASGAWKARIYNPSGGDNPGFSFTLGGIKTEWDSEIDGNTQIDVFTTGPNPGEEARRGFVLFTLASDPRCKQVLILTQNKN